MCGLYREIGGSTPKISQDSSQKGKNMFTITMGKGFQMTFANGWTVSVQWGFGNYCGNHDAARSDFRDDHGVDFRGSDAEIAAWNCDGNWHRFEDDDVKGHCNSEEVADFITMIRAK